MTFVAGNVTVSGMMLPMSTNLPLKRIMSGPSNVAGHAAHVGTLVVAVVAPVMEMGAADRGRRVLDQDAAGLDLRRRQRLELERLPGLVQNDGQSLGHPRLL